MKKITFSLDEKSIRKAIRQLNEYKSWVHKMAMELVKRLADIGLNATETGFAQATVNPEAIKNKEPYADTPEPTSTEVVEIGNGYKITAKGDDVMFIEFGAGVYFNGSEPHPNRPSNVAGIGQYGAGKGKRNAWGYKDTDGMVVITRGTPAQMPMYKAKEEMRSKVIQVAREVFG